MANSSQRDIAEKALEMKQSKEGSKDYLDHQKDHAGEGPISELNQEEPVSGALDAEGHRPVLERSRKVR